MTRERYKIYFDLNYSGEKDSILKYSHRYPIMMSSKSALLSRFKRYMLRDFRDLVLLTHAKVSFVVLRDSDNTPVSYGSVSFRTDVRFHFIKE